nr:hypothetical protein [Tanacetum cinerariifolium]
YEFLSYTTQIISGKRVVIGISRPLRSSHRNHGHNNDRHGSDRRGGGDNHRSNNNYSGNNMLNFKSIQSSSTHKHDPNITVSPTHGVRRFGIKGKLSPRFIGPFEILDHVGEVLYRLALPPQLSHVHNVFHVSLLRGYKYHPLHGISYPLDQIRADLSYVEEPEAILDRQDRVMRNKTIPFVKILWRNHPEREATWETEESIRTSYPPFLP